MTITPGKTFPGGKGGSGVYQTIINQMPPHLVYIEAFLGSGRILRTKRPAPMANIGIDADSDVLDDFIIQAELDGTRSGYTLIYGDAIEWLRTSMEAQRPQTLVYLDPPYLMSTRRQQRQYYRYEMDEQDHIAMLDVIGSLPCMVMISGYWSDLYLQYLHNWRACTYPANTRGGRQAEEWLWMNFPEPFELHDYRFLGENFRERERIKRKIKRWKNKLQKMGTLERYAILSAVDSLQPGSILGNGDADPIVADVVIDMNSDGISPQTSTIDRNADVVDIAEAGVGIH